jgi:hypothetical protein
MRPYATIFDGHCSRCNYANPVYMLVCTYEYPFVDVSGDNQTAHAFFCKKNKMDVSSNGHVNIH